MKPVPTSELQVADPHAPHKKTFDNTDNSIHDDSCYDSYKPATKTLKTHERTRCSDEAHIAMSERIATLEASLGSQIADHAALFRAVDSLRLQVAPRLGDELDAVGWDDSFADSSFAIGVRTSSPLRTLAGVQDEIDTHDSGNQHTKTDMMDDRRKVTLW